MFDDVLLQTRFEMLPASTSPTGSDNAMEQFRVSES